MKTLTLQFSGVGYARQAIFHRSREAWRNAVSELPKLARQDVKPHPDRSNLVPSTNSQFLNSKSLDETIQAPPPIVAAPPLQMERPPGTSQPYGALQKFYQK